MNNIETFERLESNVRMYCRDLPLVFDTAQGSKIRGEDGREYLDFFAGAGALNYGHNDPRMRDALIGYLSSNGVAHALDLHTTTKRQFLEAIERDLFKPRGWDYKVQFTGPTGANAVEAGKRLLDGLHACGAVHARNGKHRLAEVVSERLARERDLLARTVREILQTCRRAAAGHGSGRIWL